MTTTTVQKEMISMATSAPRVTGLAEPARTTRPGVRIPERRVLTLGAIAAGTGVVLQMVLDHLHPHHEQPNNSVAAFTEYSHAHAWTAVHIGQFFGVLLIAVSLLVLSRTLARQPGSAGLLAGVGGVAVIVLTGVFAVQMAIDGVALKHAVTTWVNAGAAAKPAAFEVADGLRWVEKGLSGFFHLMNGTALLALGLSIVAGHRYRSWPGWVAIVAGAGFIAGGAATATTGFSARSAAILQPSLLLLVVFLIGTYASLLRADRRSRRDES